MSPKRLRHLHHLHHLHQHHMRDLKRSKSSSFVLSVVLVLPKKKESSTKEKVDEAVTQDVLNIKESSTKEKVDEDVTQDVLNIKELSTKEQVDEAVTQDVLNSFIFTSEFEKEKKSLSISTMEDFFDKVKNSKDIRSFVKEYGKVLERLRITSKNTCSLGAEWAKWAMYMDNRHGGMFE